MRNSGLGGSIGLLLGISVAAIWLALAPAPVAAEGVKAAAAPMPKAAVKPARKTSPAIAAIEPPPSAPNRYFIEFRSRAAATYGHMYVLYGQVNGHDQIVRSEIAGLHPAGDANDCENCSVVPWTIGHVIFVPAETGASDGDLEEKYVTSRYRVTLDEAQYQRVAAYIKQLRANSKLWNALWRNCVSFGGDIARFMGLRAPTLSWMEPKEFVDELRELNGGHPQEPLADAPTAAENENAASAPPPPATAKTSAARPKSRKPAASRLPAGQTAGMVSGTPR